jgi:LPXTG-site transpeptidase (sortase) family protein
VHHMPKRKNKKLLSLKRTPLRYNKFLPKNLPVTRIFLGLGVFLIVTSLLLRLHYTARLSFSSELPTSQPHYTTSTPTRITISTIDLNQPVYPTSIKNGIWEISEHGISHLKASGHPGQNTNMIYYGHNTIDRLGQLHLIKKNDIITITDQYGKKYKYKVYERVVVYPTEMEKLIEHTEESLTIYTCTGFADSQRLLVKAKKV